MKVVLCVGCWDLFHVGHLAHLEAAYELGSELVVGITRDKYIGKGAGRPVIRERDRMRIVQAIWCVEQVHLVKSSLEALKTFDPKVFALGSDYKRKVLKEDRDFCERHGIEIKFTNEPRFSTTAIYDRIRASL